MAAAAAGGGNGPARGQSGGHPSGNRGGATQAVTRGESHGRAAIAAGGSTTTPTGQRSRGERTAVGTAVERQGPPPHGGGDHGHGYYPGYYYPFAYGVAWDPFWWGGYGYGDPGGYPVYGGGGGSTDVWYGGLKLKVKPSDAQVYVDGYFSGLVDDYDGMFQKLNLEVGGHHIEIRAEGYESLAFDVRIDYDQTVTYRGELQKLPR
jgi:PEGA domain-containing protein